MIERKHIEAILDANECCNCEYVQAACLAALAACDEIPWRSMESAPGDAEPVLLWAPGFSDRPIVGYRFTGGKWRTEGGYDILHPTHWMPLPAEPEVVQAQVDRP